MAIPFLIPVVKMAVVAFAGASVARATDTYIKPLVPKNIAPDVPLQPGKILSFRTIWLAAVAVVAFMLVRFVGNLLGITILKRKI